MNLTQTIFEVIDLRSFSNLWYWIALAVMWSTASHYVLGVPFDLIQRAAREGGEAFDDLQSIVRVNVNRLLFIARGSGLWLTGFVTFVLTGLFILAAFYHIEFAQAVILMAFPMTLVGLLSIFTAYAIEAEGLDKTTLFGRLRRHRTYTQFIGMASIFVTAIFGMYQNLGGAYGF
ncbi:component of SufBCD complex [Marivivens niveibacter]|uniref:Component of SufBCD complex n=1 Tax=Marivivens niveibacter TaxID=1930667 RepID=A0A251X2Z7_9RHOB|nr:component of SufBCD complex [Marivivens niveibacter]OUD11057.1 component of SufBCD complex [Marivivens niveibacter]